MFDVFALFVLAIIVFFLTFGLGIITGTDWNNVKIPTNIPPALRKSFTNPLLSTLPPKAEVHKSSPAIKRTIVSDLRRRQSATSFSEILNNSLKESNTSEDKEAAEAMKRLFPKGFNSPSKNQSNESAEQELERAASELTNIQN
ncbi:serine hydroxymethyltransferase [Acrasis kona]|uniref:Serine hydroxymethyltransferase n=1 Tax=Acrasis kona TaxID=1008807 RepID=A0AAW2YYZ5_9EUKA